MSEWFPKLLKSGGQHFYPTFLLFWGKMNWKTFLLVRSDILQLLFNTSTADYKYSRQNKENFQQPIQMQLSRKRKNFCESFIPFLECT